MVIQLSVLFIAFCGCAGLNITNIPETGPPPTKRMHSSMAYDVISNSLVLYGGFSSGFHEDIWSFHLESRTWEQLILVTETSPGARMNSFLFTLMQSSSVYLFGGKNERGPILDLFVFDLKNQAVFSM